MAGFSDGVENAVLDQVLRAVDYTIAAGLRASLHTGDPGEAGTSNEVTNSGGSTYARQVISWNAASGGVCTLAANTDFANMPACTVTHFGVWTAAGVYIGGGTTTNRTLSLGDTYRLNATTTTFSLD
jgi:hypothetical protein